MNNDLTVCIVGLGYIGLPTATVVAASGHHVVGVDLQGAVVESINRGVAHFTEPELDAALHHVVESGQLRAQQTVQPSDVFMVCVPTPTDEHHRGDISMVGAAIRSIAPHVRPGNLIIVESTCPPRTLIDRVAPILISYGFEPGVDVHVAYCPERVLPGNILTELVENDRLAGGLTSVCAQQAADFLKTYVKGDVVECDSVTAETVKLVENSYRDLNIAFANQLSMCAEQLGIRASEVIALANRHPRVNVMAPGPGVGGHCISVDPWFLIHAVPNGFTLLETAREVNRAKERFVVDHVVTMAQDHRCNNVVLLGLTYKPNSDDLRESPALAIARELNALNQFGVVAVDPFVEPQRVPDLRIEPLEHLMELDRDTTLVVRLVPHACFDHVEPRSVACAWFDSLDDWHPMNTQAQIACTS